MVYEYRFGIVKYRGWSCSCVEGGMVLSEFWSDCLGGDEAGSSGGSRLMYQLIGLVAIFFGFLLIFNLFGGIVRMIFVPTAPSF